MRIGETDVAQPGKEISRLWLTAALTYFTAAAVTIHLTSNGRDIATIWPANAILVALLLSDPRPRWGTVLSAGFVANVAANLITRGTLAGPILYGFANLIEVGLAAFLLQGAGKQDGILQSTSAVVRFMVVAGLLAPAASALTGSLTAFLIFGEPLLKSFFTWLASDGLGLLVFTPICLAAFRGDFVTWSIRKTWWERGEAVALLALTGAVAFFVFFGTSRPFLFAIFPPMMLVTFRIGRLGTKAAVMIVAVIGGLATIQGHGPMILVAADAATQAHAFQAFLAVMLMTCLPVAAEVTARARLTAALAAHDKDMTICAVTDPLTGLFNRRGFELEVKKLLPKDESASLSVIAIDFDYFKQINDRWGHQAGDLALRHLASLLSLHVRAGDLVARLGGDEFMILLPDSTLELAKKIGERIREGVHSSPLPINDGTVTFISISMGVASAHSHESYERLAQRVDRALYDAKEAGRNTLRWTA